MRSPSDIARDEDVLRAEARAMRAEAKRQAARIDELEAEVRRLRAGLEEALAIYDEKCIGCSNTSSCDCPSGYHTDDCRAKREAALRALVGK